jgi:ribonuclease D
MGDRTRRLLPPGHPLRVKYESITSDRSLNELVERIAGSKLVAFDTEFVSEDTYRPEICLVQVAIDGYLAVIDPKGVMDLAPFWRALAAPGHETVVHSGREELRFCLQSCRARPNNLFDVQIAAGLVGLEYPAAYSTLISRLLGERLAKGETRTDWRRRPLSAQQLEYALLDVVHLSRVRDILHERLVELDRLDWLSAEMQSWQEDIETAERQSRWHRVPGISGLGSRSLAIVRELWEWREEEARRRDVPVRRVLRDDLLVELARRHTADIHRIKAVRGLEHRHLVKQLPEIARRIAKAVELPQEQCPRPLRRENSSQLNVLASFLATVLASVSRASRVAPSLVGSVHDVRDLVAARLELPEARDNGPPLLAQGWRAKVVGQSINDLLAGRLAIRVRDPLAEDPLILEAADLRPGGAAN